WRPTRSDSHRSPSRGRRQPRHRRPIPRPRNPRRSGQHRPCRTLVAPPRATRPYWPPRTREFPGSWPRGFLCAKPQGRARNIRRRWRARPAWSARRAGRRPGRRAVNSARRARGELRAPSASYRERRTRSRLPRAQLALIALSAQIARGLVNSLQAWHDHANDGDAYFRLAQLDRHRFLDADTLQTSEQRLQIAVETVTRPVDNAAKVALGLGRVEALKRAFMDARVICPHVKCHPQIVARPRDQRDARLGSLGQRSQQGDRPARVAARADARQMRPPESWLGIEHDTTESGNADVGGEIPHANFHGGGFEQLEHVHAVFVIDGCEVDQR